MDCAVRPAHLPALPPSNCGWRQQTNAQSVSDRTWTARVQACPVSISSSSGPSTSRTAGCTVNVNGRWRGRERRNSAAKAVTSCDQQQWSFAVRMSLFPNREDNCTSLVCRAQRLASHQRRTRQDCSVAGPKMSHGAAPKLSHSAAPKLSYGAAPKPSYGAASKLSYGAASKLSYGAGSELSYGAGSKLSYGAAPKLSYGAAPKLSYGAGSKLSYGAGSKLSYGDAPKPSHGFGMAIGERWIPSKSSGSGCNERFSENSRGGRGGRGGKGGRVLSAAKRGCALRPRLDQCSKLGPSYGPPKATNDDEEEEEYEIEEEELEREKEPFVPPTGGIYGRPSVEKLFKLKVEKPSKERLEELHVSKWSKWESGRTFWAWEWKVDEMCFIEKGELEITPRESTRSAVFKAGDMVTFPKWLRARCEVREPLEMRYRFRAIGDAVGIES